MSERNLWILAIGGLLVGVPVAFAAGSVVGVAVANYLWRFGL